MKLQPGRKRHTIFRLPAETRAQLAALAPEGKATEYLCELIDDAARKRGLDLPGGRPRPTGRPRKSD